MPIDETLTKINALAATAEEALVNLWNDLEAEFKQDPDLKDTDFTAWALVNVNRKILKIALDKKLAGEIASLGHRFLSRYANVLEALDVSLGLLLQLFGPKVISSRACNASFIELCKVCPKLRIQELHNAWTAQPTGIGSRRIADVTRFQRAVKSIDDSIGPNVQKPKKKADAREMTPSIAASIENADQQIISRDASPQTPTRDRSLPLQDARRSYSDSPEQPRRYHHVQQSEMSPPSFTPSPLAKRAVPQSSFLLERFRPIVQRRIQNPGFPLLEPNSENGQGAPFVDWEAGGDDTSGLGLSQSPCYLPRSDELSAMEVPGAETVKEDGTRRALFQLPRGHQASVEGPSKIADAHSFVESSPSRHSDDVGLSTIAEEASLAETAVYEHKDEVAQMMISNVTIRPSRKRAYSDSAASQSVQDKQTPPAASDKRPRFVAKQPATLGDAGTHCSTARRTVNLLTVMHGIETLKDGRWLNDEVINTIGRRLASDKIGVIGSLSVASKSRTDRHRQLLQATMNRPTILLFVNDSSHWVLFTWTPQESTLTEYNSMSHGYCCFGNSLVPDFVRWLHNDPDLRIIFRKQTCPQQPNDYDCGVYALVFARHIAAGEPLPTTIVGSRERLYLRRCMLASDDRALVPTEGGSKCPTLRDRVETIKHLTRRRRNYAELLEDEPNDLLEWVARKGLFQICQSALADAFASFHKMHLMAVESALCLETRARDAERDRKELEDLHKALREVLKRDELAARIEQGRSSIKLSEGAISHLSIFRQSSRLIDADLKNLLEADDWRFLATQTCLAYREANVLILVLNYTVKKFRRNAMDMDNYHSAAQKKLQEYL